MPLRRSLLSALLRLPIIRSNKAYQNILLWPVANKLFGKKYSEIIKMKNGVLINVHQDVYDMTNKRIMFFGEKELYPYEPATSELVTRIIKNKRGVLIAGAHFGYYVLLCRSVASDISIVAFEPGKKMRQYLEQNLRLNNVADVFVESFALSDRSGQAEFVVDAGQSSLVQHEKNILQPREFVSLTTIDHYCSSHSFEPDLLILDLEGYEVKALKGAEEYIRLKGPDMIIEVNDGMLRRTGASSESLYDLLSSLGYAWEKISDYKDSEDWFNIYATKKSA